MHDLNEEVLKIEELEAKKSVLLGNCEEKNKFLNKLPNEIKKISDLMKEFMDIFKINESLHPEQGLVLFVIFFFIFSILPIFIIYFKKKLAKQLPQPLHNIYYKFSGLSLSKIDSNLSITILSNSYLKIHISLSFLTGKDKPEAGKYKMDPLELMLLLEETPEKKQEIQNMIKKFKYQNIDLNSIFPVKIFIRYLVDFDVVVLQLDNKNFFTTEELITNLVKNDPGSQIFLNPGIFYFYFTFFDF